MWPTVHNPVYISLVIPEVRSMKYEVRSGNPRSTKYEVCGNSRSTKYEVGSTKLMTKEKIYLLLLGLGAMKMRGAHSYAELVINS